MTAPATKVDIWNMALDYIGETAELQSEDDPSTAAEVCGRHYDKLLRELLAEDSFPWRWATKQLAAVVVDDSNGDEVARDGWDHTYALPADCVTPIGLLYSGVRFDLLAVTQRVDWDIMANDASDGQVLVCDLATTDIDTIEYVALFEYVPAMPAMFQEALALRLASVLAKALRKDQQLSLMLRQEAMAALEEAQSQSSNNRNISIRPMTPSELARQ